MRIALISDTHFGIRNDHQAVLSHFEKFYDNVFFPYLDKHEITNVIHLGDLVDRRKYINYHTQEKMRTCFLDVIRQLDLEMYLIAGNHDVFYKDTNRINGLKSLGHRIHVIDEFPKTIQLGNTKVAMFPWICLENETKSMDMLTESKCEYVFGHFEINGAEMFRGTFSDHGMDRNIFKRFKRVFSGHFHQKSTINNIEYLGAPYEMTWSDADCLRGFHVFDLEKNELEFIPNPHKLFHKVIYDDVGYKNIDDMLSAYDFSKYNNTFVKVAVFNKVNPFWFDVMMERIENAHPIDLKVVEESISIEYSDEEIGQSVDDPLTILKNHCKSEKHSELVERKLVQLYNQAIASTI